MGCSPGTAKEISLMLLPLEDALRVACDITTVARFGGELCFALKCVAEKTQFGANRLDRLAPTIDANRGRAHDPLQIIVHA
jgi:hypothetical protein